MKVDNTAVKGRKNVERIRTDIKERRAKVEQLKKDKLEAEVSIEELKKNYTRFKQAKKERTAESTDGQRRMAELAEAKTQVEEYKKKINETDWADAVAEYHKVSEANLMVKLQSQKEEQTQKRKDALEEIRLLEADLKKANNDVNVALSLIHI